MESLDFVTVADAAIAVAAESGRKRKGELLADVLRACAPPDLPIVVGLLTGELRQGRIGVGWSSVREVDIAAAGSPTLTVAAVDEAFSKLAATHGEGSRGQRHRLLSDLLSQATSPEADLLRAVLTGGLRQGALKGVMVDGIAKAHDVTATVVRRAAMLSGDLGTVAFIAATEGKAGLEAVGLQPLRGIEPMLAATSATAGEAVAELGESVVQVKLDGIRIQAHRSGNEVRLFTRNLNDVTDRLAGVTELITGLACDTVVLDGEVIGIAEDSPEMFQDTASAFSTQTPGVDQRAQLQVQFFDVLHRDGVDLIDLPLRDRLVHLQELVPDHAIDGITTADPDVANRFSDETVAAGHEGVLVKAVDSPYAAGRRGKTWRKVKPVHTFDLVVLGAEWGHGRRQGWLSNLHLGARATQSDGTAEDGTHEYVMVGKTFKGLTDKLLAWQTEAILAAEDRREGITVFARPELVVEIAIDGVQRSTTYPGGLALRFARVKGYRSDKTPAEANTLDDLRALFS